MKSERQSVELKHILQGKNKNGEYILHCSKCNVDMETDEFWGISEAQIGIFVNAHRHDAIKSLEKKV